MDSGPDTSGALGVLEQADVATETPWQVVLWNDPVNDMAYVSFALIEVLEIDSDAADRLMLLAHTEGKTAVFSGTKSKAAAIAERLGTWQLTLTVEKGN